MITSNIGLVSAIPDPFGKTAQVMMNELASPKGFDEGTCLELISGMTGANDHHIIASVKDFDIRRNQRFKINKSYPNMFNLDDIVARRELELYVKMRQHRGMVTLAAGVSCFTGISAPLPSETGMGTGASKTPAA